ncbi:hypothetical protein [Chitinophaga pinensis]|nr:hypothetical protein [Chitinophaga pinensis]
MFKITLHDKTMAGNNEDAWKINSKIWFEKGADSQYGAAYVGHSDLFPQGGYQRGQQFPSQHSDTTLAFCTSMMDTMHECMNKMGDGTTYTAIYDLKERMINLYFYHDFKHVVRFNLIAELKKGNHLLNIPDLFPPNHEYLRFVHFKTPFNSSFIKLLLYVMELLLALLTLYWAIYILGVLFNGRINIKAHYGMCLLLILNIGLGSYLFILQNNQPLFYYDAPYYVPGKTILNVSAYLPVVLLGLIIPVGLANIRTVHRASVTTFTRRVFMLNTIIYLVALLLFAYWGLLFIIRS